MKASSVLLAYKLIADGSLVSIRAKLNHRLLKGRFEFEVTLKMFLSSVLLKKVRGRTTELVQGGENFLGFFDRDGRWHKGVTVHEPLDIVDCSLCTQSQQQQQWDKELGMSSLLLPCLETPYLQDRIIDFKNNEGNQ